MTLTLDHDATAWVEYGEVFCLSLRAQDWLLAVDVEDAAIRWRFGREGHVTLVRDLDDAVSAEVSGREWMYGQHDIPFRAPEGRQTRFTVFDNGFFRPGVSVRLVAGLRGLRRRLQPGVVVPESVRAGLLAGGLSRRGLSPPSPPRSSTRPPPCSPDSASG